MTSLPLVVVNTHGHCDHALGNDQFDHVLLGAYDADRLSARDLETKREFVRLGEPLSRARSMPSFDRWGCPARMGCGIVEDEMPIELGSRTVRAYLTPGHTVGSVCYVDEGSRTLFAGDSYVPLASWGPMWLHLDESASLSRFHDAMSRLLGVGGFDSILSGHGECGPLPATRLEGLLSGIRSVVRGEVEGVPVKTIAGEGLRCDWADTGIIYKERSE